MQFSTSKGRVETPRNHQWDRSIFNRMKLKFGLRNHSGLACLAILAISAAFPSPLNSQTSSTGALTGVTLDPSGAFVPGAVVQIENQDTANTQSTTTDQKGRFRFSLLPPGSYVLTTSKTGFELLRTAAINIRVTETSRVELRLQLGTSIRRVAVSSKPLMIQTDNSALGRVVNETAVSGLPLVTRNFAQIAGLSPGVVSGVFNAGELGLGEFALPQINESNDGIYAHGARSYDNNWQLDGLSVNDVQGSGFSSGGIPVPNPDAIQEFKVQTGLYDAAYGRYAAANVSVVTKRGGNTLHGSIFEFRRNDLLNANDFFLNRTGQSRAPLKQNQFGFTLGGPVKKEKLFFFGSYQGTRQVNGVAAGQARVACTASLSSPPITDNRSPAALGALFGGMTGALGGVAIKPDGSNLNPVALALLNYRLPDGTFLIPTPQTVDRSKPFAGQGFSVFVEPCHFGEDQFLTNIDYLASQRNKISARFFFAGDSETVTFPGNGLNAAGNTPGFPSPNNTGFRVFSLTHTYVPSSAMLNELRIGYVRTRSDTEARTPFSWSDIGVSEGEMNNNNGLPSLSILGSLSIASGFPRVFAQNSFVFSEALSFIRRAHFIRLGGSITRPQDNVANRGLGTLVEFLSWPDFLLGLSAAGNGTGKFSNVFASLDAFGLADREYRVWEGSAFAQDDYRVSKSLTLNAGVRYERLGQFGDRLGRDSSFDIGRADPNPPPDGSVAGYIVASNFPGTLPVGVQRAENTFGNEGLGQNTIAPRFGFAWQFLPGRRLLVLAGICRYHLPSHRPSCIPRYLRRSLFLNFESTMGRRMRAPPSKSLSRSPSHAAVLPYFPPYSPTTTTTIYTVASAFRPALIQRYSLNVQQELLEGWLLEIGYVGTRGSHLVRQRSLNQALDAAPGNSIRGETANTIDNIPLRVPIPGIPPDSLVEMESEGSSWYNGLEVSLTKRLDHGLQFLASYTFSKTLDTDGAAVNSTSAGNALTLGDQNSARQRRGRASFDRTHRFVFSTTWTLPNPAHGMQRAILRGWALAGVVTIQSGSALTIAYTNATNVFGISEDRAQLSGTCKKSHLVRRGSVESNLDGYFNTSCFATPPVIGADGIGTAFGDSGTGIVDGPGQANLISRSPEK